MHKIAVAKTPRHPAIDAEFGRINVILGANGSGKSALIETIKNGKLHASFGCNETRLVDARRVARVAGKVDFTKPDVAQDTLESPLLLLESFKEDASSLQAQKLLTRLCKSEERSQIAYAAVAESLQREGRLLELGPREPSTLDTFKLIYAQVLPELELHFNADQKKLSIARRGTEPKYQPEHMSSGEHQVFLLLGKFIFSKGRVLFLIDEPELNLNPRLAESFWSTIERLHPDCVFIYTSHALHFALRPEVDRTLVLSKDGVISLNDSQEFMELARDDRENFLGSIPSIVLASKVLFTEGKPDSIDRALYRYILQDGLVKVEGLGSCNEVEKAVAGRSGWELFVRNAKVAGVIDADFKSPQETARLAKLGLYMLPYHEAESILCHPSLVEALSHKMHPPEKHVSSTQVVERLKARLEQRKTYIALRRAEAHFSRSIVPSVTREAAAAVATLKAAQSALRTAVESVKDVLDKVDAELLVSTEMARIDKAAAAADVDEMLRLMPGSELTGLIKELLHTPSYTDNDLLAAYQKHFPAADLPVLSQLRTGLLGLFP